MSPAPFDFGELRSLLQQPPSAQVWEALCALVFPARWEKTADQWLPYAMDQLDRRWHDDLRVMPLKWAARKRPPSALQLVRHLSLSYETSRQRDTILDMFEIARPYITHLSLHSGATWDASAARALWRALEGSLRSVALHQVMLAGPMAALMAATPALAGVERVELLHAWMSASELASLLTAPSLAQLRELGLRWHSHDDMAALGTMLTRCVAREQLRALNLSQTRLGEAGVMALASAPWPALHKLDLEMTAPGGAGLAALLDAAPNVRDLSLSGNALHDDVLGALLDHPTLRLTRLDLSFSHPSSSLLNRLLCAPQGSDISELIARAVVFDDESAGALLLGPVAASLEVLSLPNAESDALWAALRAASLPALRVLDLRGLQLNADHIAALTSAQLPALRLLDLSRSIISDEGAAALLRAPWLPKLDALWIEPHAPHTSPANLSALRAACGAHMRGEL